MAAVERALDQKTKPPGSLGSLERLACQLAGIWRSAAAASPEKAVVILGADHGVCAEGVSAYPQQVTAQMFANFAAGGAAINVLAKRAGARLVVVNLGTVDGSVAPAPVRHRPLGPGTENFTRAPAMTRAQLEGALQCGLELAEELAAGGVRLVGLGEMGIGNTTSAAALTAAYCGAAPEQVVGPGTGLDAEGRARKARVVRAGLERHQPALGDPLQTLAALGGFEIAGLAGLTIGAAARGLAIVMDGFIATAAALAAVRVAPAVRPYLIAAHRSAEPGHELLLRQLGATPLLDLELRLGEGSGAALAMPLVDASLAIVRDMATFAGAGVSQAQGPSAPDLQ